MEWISVKDRLPEEKVNVLVYHLGSYGSFDEPEGIFIAYYDKNEMQKTAPIAWVQNDPDGQRKWDEYILKFKSIPRWVTALSEWGIGEVTHWMPLPESPKENDEMV